MALGDVERVEEVVAVDVMRIVVARHGTLLHAPCSPDRTRNAPDTRVRARVPFLLHGCCDVSACSDCTHGAFGSAAAVAVVAAADVVAAVALASAVYVVQVQAAVHMDLAGVQTKAHCSALALVVAASAAVVDRRGADAAAAACHG